MVEIEQKHKVYVDEHPGRNRKRQNRRRRSKSQSAIQEILAMDVTKFFADL